jgi:hypothetical protein
LFTRDQQEARNTPSSSKGKSFSKDTKRKAAAVLAAEPHQKFQHGAEGENAGADGCPFCTYHCKSGHSTDNCYEIQKIREERGSQRKEKRPDGHGGGRGGGRGGGSWNSNQNRGNNQANAAQPRLGDGRDNVEDGAGGYQEPRGAICCILGGAQAPTSARHFKQLVREVAATHPGLNPVKLKWS